MVEREEGELCKIIGFPPCLTVLLCCSGLTKRRKGEIELFCFIFLGMGGGRITRFS